MSSPLFKHWNDLRGSADLPPFAQFDPTALPSILPDLLVMHVHRNPLDFEYSLIGSNVRLLHRQNRKGQRMSVIDGQGEGSMLWEFVSEAVAWRSPVSFVAPYAGHLENIDGVRSHATPWAGPDGTVTRLVVHICKDYLARAATWKSRYAELAF